MDSTAGLSSSHIYFLLQAPSVNIKCMQKLFDYTGARFWNLLQCLELEIYTDRPQT